MVRQQSKMKPATVHGTCGKKIYLTWRHADFDATQLRRKEERPHRPYWCLQCQHWHVGSVLSGRTSKARDDE